MRVLTCLAALTLATMPATAPAVEAAGNTSQKTANATFTPRSSDYGIRL